MRPKYSDPTAQAASSTTARPRRLAISRISFSAAGKPIWWTSRMARVRGVMASSIRRGSRLYVSRSMSTKTGVQPAWTIALAEATKERLGQMTSSPGRTGKASNAKCRAVMQEETATACEAPTYSAKRFSNSATRDPWLNHPLRSTCATASSSSRPRYGRATGIVFAANCALIDSPSCMSLRISLQAVPTRTALYQVGLLSLNPSSAITT